MHNTVLNKPSVSVFWRQGVERVTTPVPAIPEPANGNYPAGWDTETQGRWLPTHGWTPGNREAGCGRAPGSLGRK